MSLINQMLRDLQERRDGAQPVASPGPKEGRTRRPRRRITLPNLLGTVPPGVWVGIGGLAAVALLWVGSLWLSELFGPGKPSPAPVASASPPQVSPPVARRQAPTPQVRSYPPPPPPAASRPPALPSPPPAPDSSARSTPAAFAPRHTEVAAVPAAKVVASVSGVAVHPAGKLHPDMLPGAVNATNLALQQAAREAAAVPPPVITPYGQAEAAYQEGRSAYEANRGATSLAALRRALAYYPGHLPARELLADQLEMAGQDGEAFTLLQQGLAIAPDYTPFRKRAARLLLDRGDPAGATRALTGSGLPRVEDDPELHQLLAGAYLRLGENFLAAQTFRNLLVQAPQNGTYWLGLGDALTADGQPLEAGRAYRRALTAGGLSREDVARIQARPGSR